MSPIGTAGNWRSSDDIRDVRVDDPLDLVLEPELALLEPCEFQLVAGGVGGKRVDLLVEPPMFGLQGIEVEGWLIIVHDPPSLDQAGVAENRPARGTIRARPSANREMAQDKGRISWFITPR